MHIKIDHTFRPFSLETPTVVPVLQSPYVAKIFPCHVEIYDYSSSTPQFLHSLEAPSQKPVCSLVVQLDLENDRILVSGGKEKSHFSYTLSMCKGVLCINGKKSPSKKKARLFLGVSKKQDVSLMFRRFSLCELLPFIYLLAQSVEAPSYIPGDSLLDDLLQNKNPASSDFSSLLLTSFTSLFTPCEKDHLQRGFLKDPINRGNAPLSLLPKLKEVIESLFFTFSNDTLSLLPHLLPEMHTGRLVDKTVDDLGDVSLRFSKKSMHSLIIDPSRSFSLFLQVKGGIRKFRVRKSLQDKGEVQSIKEPLHIVKGQKIVLDNFLS